MKRKIGLRISARWGVALAILVSFVAMLRALSEPVPGHFRMFMGAARGIWNAAPIYGVGFVGNLYFYSPSCALFLYGPFALLPESIGLALYLAISSAVFIAGFQRFYRVFISEEKMNVFWVLILPLLFSSLVAHKLEVLMTGILFWASSILWKRDLNWKERTLSAFALGAIGVWKLQPLPCIALLSLFRLVFFKDLRWILEIALGLALWFGMPYLVRSPAYLSESYRLWHASLQGYSALSYNQFDNIYSLLKNTMGLSLSFANANALSAFAGGLIGALYAGWCWKNKRLNIAKKAVALALASGSFYTVIFSPLQQVQAYSLFVPTAFVAWLNREQAADRRFWNAILASSFTVLWFAYSDLLPPAVRYSFRHWTLRSAACLALGLAVLWQDYVRLDRPRARSTV